MNYRKKLLYILFFFLCPSAYSQGVYYAEDFETGVKNPNLQLSCTNPNQRFSIQSEVTRFGDYAARLENLPNEGKRCEVIPGDDYHNFYWGNEYWLGFSFNVPSLSAGYGILSQQHGVPGLGNNGEVDWSVQSGGNGFTIIIPGGNGPVFQIGLIPPDNLNKYQNATPQNPSSGGALGGAIYYYSWPVETNVWFDVVSNFRYSDGDDGFYKVWINGKLVIDITGMNVNIYDKVGRIQGRKYYLKAGIYSGTEGGGAVIYDEIRIGDETSSYANVAPPVEPLMIPSALTAYDSTSTSISLNWTPSIEKLGVARYDIYRDGTYVGTASTNQFTDTFLSAGTTYSYTVLAKDLMGNETAQSAAMEASTLQAQIITITPIADKFSKDAAFDVEASVNSGLELTYEVSGPASISGKTITLDGSLGVVEVTVNQAGDATYGKISQRHILK